MRFYTDKAFVAFGEPLVRLSAPGSELLLQSPMLRVCFGGAEANVAVSMAILGHRARYVGLIPNNVLGVATRDELRRFGLETEWLCFSEGRMGLYFLSPGAISRSANILYDRSHSAHALAPSDVIDWAGPLNNAGWFHVSGITAAVSRNAAEATLRALAAAKDAGLVISFDCNYRSKLWASWDESGASYLSAAIASADILFGDNRDIALIRGSKFDADPDRAREQAAEEAFGAFPDLKRIVCTYRYQHSVDHHDLSAFLFARDADDVRLPPISLSPIVDRIGGGDAFAAGVIHGLKNGWSDTRSLQFGLGAASLKHTVPGDFNLCSEADILLSLESGPLDVRR